LYYLGCFIDILWSTDSKRICQQNNTNPYGKIDTREQKHPSVFSDLTRREMKGLLQYLFANIDLNLTTPEKATIHTNNLYLAELHLPPKKAVLDYIDKGCRKPPREAHVILIRRGIKQPDVREIIVGPFPNPSYHRPVPYRPQSISFLKRPFTPIDDIAQNLTKLMDKSTGGMLQELYGGRLIQCGNRCLRLAEMTGMTSAISGERKILQWFNLYHFTEYWMLRPLDFAILVELTAGKYNIINIWFNGKVFKSIRYVLGYYKKNKHLIKKISFPVPSKSSPLTMKKRGKSPFSVPLRNPSQISPDGKRYNIQGRKVIYMFWEFHVGMSPISGPRLFDIRFKGERIAYEISLQELTVFYSGYKPVDYTANYFDGGLLIGVRSKYLVPDVDCPHGATYLSAYFQLGKEKKPSYNPRAYCIFEFNTGIPLRRHHGRSKNFHRFYEGLVSVVLIVRTISTIGNYDYITDFIFYHNGAIEIKITASGVIIGTFHGHKNQYGFEISKNLMGPIHQHLYHFKVDLDIKGTKNRFSTIDIENDVIPNIWHKNVNENIHQTKFVERLKSTEKEAAHTFNFDEPKLLIFSNNKFNDKYGNTPGYKILNEGMSKNIRPPLKGNEQAMSWSQYQVAITKQKDDEPRSSSIYARAGPDDPVVTFQDFIDDDENIVDEVSQEKYQNIRKYTCCC
jgi:diamine oxidase